MPLNVLVLCTGNSARSQMAEAIFRHGSHGKINVASAGSAPQGEIHPKARIAIQQLLNLDMEGQYPKRLDQFTGQAFDYIITVRAIHLSPNVARCSSDDARRRRRFRLLSADDDV